MEKYGKFWLAATFFSAKYSRKEKLNLRIRITLSIYLNIYFCLLQTGTLTEDGLDMWGVVPIRDVKVQDVVKEPHLLDTESNLLRAMSSCHSLAVVDGELTGDPLDFKVNIKTILN